MVIFYDGGRAPRDPGPCLDFYAEAGKFAVRNLGVHRCNNCGWPVLDGYRCTYCGDDNPKG